ncbi:MAG TPA: SCO family protein, partial [Candidatus Polarisedimenticolia bacterium]|nr:SCO family protein [Candidatus Polarisedimenticolia bacterium]
AAAMLSPAASAQPAGLPPQLEDVGIDQRLGETLPLDAALRDEQGREVRLGDFFGEDPVLLVFAYYRCPMLCTLVLNGVVRAARALEFEAGREYRIVTISIDPSETPDLARAKKEETVRAYGRSGAAAGWSFLTGDAEAVRAVTAAAGFRYARDEQTGEWAHASGIILATPEGRLSHYFYGVEYAPRDLRLGLVEASRRAIGDTVDTLLLFCFHYDPATGKYGLAILSLLRAAGAATALGLAGFIALMLRRERRAVPAGGRA